MKINYNHFKKKMAVFALASMGFTAQAQLTTLTFTHTGATHTFVIPPCVGSMTIEARGAGGGTGQSSSNPGLGGSARGVITATPGQVLYLNVGGSGSLTAGGFNGGGGGGTSLSSNGGGGGGASDIRVGSNALASRIMVAGGGGGSGGNGFGGPYNAFGGNGGGGSMATSGQAWGGGGASGCAIGSNGAEGGGTAPGYGSGGGGGGFTSGGSGGGQPGAGSGGYGCNGALGAGGDGGGNSFICGGISGGQNGGGGGGGGFYGGGGGMTGTGGCNGGGGGGSSYISTMFSTVSFVQGIQTGHGVITMTYALNGAGVTASTNTNIICAGSSVSLTAASVVSYTWLPVGTFAGSNSAAIVDAPASSVNYTVQGTNSIGCISSTVIPVMVNAGVPSLSVANTASASSGICPTKSVNLLASGAITYTWNNSVSNGVTFFPVSTNTYVVTGGNACGTSSAAVSVSIHPLPTVFPSASSSSLCSGTTLSLVATGNATNYTWTGGTAPGGNNVGFFPTLTTTYTATGTSSLSCTNTAVISVTVVTTPVAIPVASPPLICIGKSSTLTATGATSYTWASSTQTVNTPSFTVTPPAPGVSSYTVTKSNANCFDTRVINVTTNALPSVFAIASPPQVCALNPSTLSIGGGSSYTWTAPGTPNFTFTGASPIVYPATSSNYTVAASDGTCTSVITVSVTVDANPVITISGGTPSLCIGQQVSMTASGGINYTWTAGSSTFNTAQITDSPTTSIVYNVSGDNAAGCIAGNSYIVIVYQKPPVNATAGKQIVCSGGPVVLTASGANTYTWSANANSAQTHTVTVNPVSAVTGPVVYTVTGSDANIGCQASKTVQVNVYVPVLSISGATNTCAGGLINLTVTGGNLNSYSWNTGTNIFNSQSISTNVSTAGVFTVTANSSTPGITCPGSQTIAVGINANPTVVATAQRSVVCKGESVDLYASGGAVYAWSNSMSGPTITVIPQVPTNNYVLTGTDANGCTGSSTVQVKMSQCLGVNELSGAAGLMIYPNPNKGSFTIKADTELELTLSNELGQSIQVIQLKADNDHKVSLNHLAEGLYFISGQNAQLQVKQKIVVTR